MSVQAATSKIGTRRRLQSRWQVSLIAICGAILIFGTLGACSSSSKIEVGTVEFKEVVGIKDNQERTILTIKSDAFALEDSSYTEAFSGVEPGPRIDIDQTLADWLNDDYDSVKYLVGIRQCDDGDLERYFAGREDFNKLSPGLIAKFELDPYRGNSIRNLIEY